MNGVGRRSLWAVAYVVSVAAAACGGGSSPSSPTTPTPTPTHPLPAMSVMLAEKVLGSAAAPVTMVEYSSLTCPHCGDYHVSTLPQLKAAYVDTGRLKIVYRDFPLNQAALAGSMVARCSGDGFFTTLDALYRAQSAWAFANDYTAGLKSVVAPLGMTSSDVDACLASTDLANGVLAIKATATQTDAINATPTFVLNGQKIFGALSFAEFSALINAY
jgi:protein-disulfide isomerase